MSVITSVTEVVKLVQTIDNVDLLRKILTLQNEIMALSEENASLKAQNRTLQERLSLTAILSFRDNAYWRARDDGTEDGPFCSTCWDVDQRLVRGTAEFLFAGEFTTVCKYCKHHRTPKGLP
jgi:hypothetical protein